MKVKEFLRWWIFNSGLSQKEFAERCGVKPPMVNEWLTGKRSVTPRGAALLEKATGIPAIVWCVYQDCDELTEESKKECDMAKKRNKKPKED